MNLFLGIVLIVSGMVLSGCSDGIKRCHENTLYFCNSENVCELVRLESGESVTCFSYSPFGDIPDMKQDRGNLIPMVEVDLINQLLLKHNLRYLWQDKMIFEYKSLSDENIVTPAHQHGEVYLKAIPKNQRTRK